MNNPEKEEKWNKEFNEEWRDLWLPLITTRGNLDGQKIKNELQDLVFIYKQVAEVYLYITGNQLSKAMYYSDVITTAYDDELNKLIKEDRERIVKLIDKEIDYDSVIDIDDEEIFTEEIKLYNEEIDELKDKIMEE